MVTRMVLFPVRADRYSGMEATSVFPLSGLHLCNVSRKEGNSAHYLHVIGIHAKDPAGCLPDDGIGLRQERARGFPFLQAGAKFARLCLERCIGERSGFRRKGVDPAKRSF